MTAEGPQAGLTHSRSLIVDPSVIVPALTPLLGPLTDMPPMLVTAWMMGFVEATCIDTLKPFLGRGRRPWAPMSISAMWRRRPWACG